MPFQVWKRSENGWTSTTENRTILPLAYQMPSDLTAEFGEIVRSKYPHLFGMVGTTMNGLQRIDPERLLRSLTSRLYEELQLTPPEEAISRLTKEFQSYAESTTVRVRFLAPIHNLSMDEGIRDVPLWKGLVLRQLNEAEFSDLHGGMFDWNFPWLGTRTVSMPTCVFTGEVSVPLLFQTPEQLTSPERTELDSTLNRAIMAMRTFKSGPIGYEELRIYPFSMFTEGFGTHFTWNEYVPFGSYRLTESELPSFREHVSYFEHSLHPSMDVACSRLADAEIRTRSRDKLVDAVIGMEAILLYMPNERYRQELRYRFALNYSTLFDSAEERFRQFRIAQDIYDLRSSVAHGAAVDESASLRLGEQKLALPEIAQRSCTMLREIVQTFLPQSGNPPYTRIRYWDERIFGQGAVTQ